MPTICPLLALLLIPVLASVLSFAAGGAHAQAPRRFEFDLPARADAPVIACTPEELARLRTAYAGEGAAHDVVAAVVHQADRALAQPLTFPPRGGQHNQWYQCEPCQMGLETIDATHHRCPRCEKVYTGEPYDDVVMGRAHDRNLRDMAACAWAHAITGRADYAQRAAAVLLGYAERYMQYERHDSRLRTGAQASRSGARLFEQTLNEAAAMTQRIAPAYDLIQGTLSDAERQAIQDGLILPMLENMAGHPAGRSNWQTWHNAAMLWGGAVLRDEAWIQRALTDFGNGFLSQMVLSVTADGAWYENSWSYHFYTLSAMTALAEGGRRLGIDLWSHPSLKKMYLLPMRYVMPDGTLPRFGDATTFMPRHAAPFMEVAWHAYRDPVILPALPDKPIWETVLLGRTVQPADERAAAPATSELFPAAGHAILRSEANTLAAAMTFGAFGGFHDHFDKLGFVFFGYEQELGVDPGRAKSQAYRLPIHQHWYRATLSHNAVLVDGGPHREANARLELFAVGEQASAVRASVEAWPTVKQTRLLVLMPEYLLVLDELDAQAPHTFDWLYHNHGSEAISDIAHEPVSLGEAYPGIEFVDNLRQGATDAMVRIRFPGEALTTHLTLDAQPGTQVRVGDGPWGTVLERVPMAMIARRGQQVRFAATIEPVPAGAQPSVQAVQLTSSDAGFVVDIERGGSSDRIALAPDGSLRVQRDGSELLSGKPDAQADIARPDDVTLEAREKLSPPMEPHAMSDRKQPLLIVSCTVSDDNEGLRSYRFDPQRGTLTLVSSTGEGVGSPIYATVDPDRRFVYVADHVKESDGKPGGAVAAYALDSATGQLTFLNRQSSQGLVPCYVSITADRRHAFVANYGGGNVAMLPIEAHGRLGPASDVKSHAASDNDEPRAHSILPDPANRFAIAADLGVDRIFSYRIDAQAGKLVPNDPPFVQTAAKAGPRHLAFHPNGKLLYAMTEYDNTVIAMHYNADKGQLEIFQVEPALPEGYSETSYGSDIHIHPNGRWLFAANRGHDSIVTFAIDADTGGLTLHGHTPTQGSFPRSFVIDPTGAFLLVGNEKSNEIRIFKLDANTGDLTPTDTVIEAPAPAGLTFE